MKKVYLLSQVDETKCLACKICENVSPTGAIKVVNKKAKVDEKKCAACFQCMDACTEGAISSVRRQEVLTLSLDPGEVDQQRLRELCNKAHFNPEDTICLCTLIKAKEVAAAILKGAESPEEISLMTGVRTSCGMYCISPILRLLRAHGVDLTPPKGYNWYDAQVGLWDIPDEVAKKYPKYSIEEDKQLFNEGVFDNLVPILRKKGALL